VLPLRRGPGVTVLPEGDLERIHEASLRVLEETGVEIGPGVIARRLEAAGATVDDETGRVRFPRALVEEAMRHAPRELLLAARDPDCDLRVDGTAGWLSPGGHAAEIIDPETGDRRPSTKADFAAIARVADAVPQMGLLGPSVTALDVPAVGRLLHELHAQYANASKHVQHMAADIRTAEGTVDIARIVAGGERQLRERPVLSALVRSRSPLACEGEALEAAVAYAEAGVPCGFMVAPVAGAASHATGAGSLVLAHAGALAGVVTLQLLVPGAPTFSGTDGGVADAASMTAISGGPEDLRFRMALTELAHRNGLPVQIGTFATGAMTPDWQAGLEGGLSSLTAWLAGADLLSAAGALGGARVFSLANMLLDTELFDLVRQVPLGFEMDEEAMAVEVIEKVGPGGHFLGEGHTLRHMREAWMSRFMSKDTWEAWEESGRPEPPSRAAERALELLASHEPAPLPPGVEERILEVIAEHERDHIG
jgi:trimethylamine--corrinoid protein Co-methyltransferase